jgi:hypothetical protein
MSTLWSRIGLGALCLGLACSSLRAAEAAKPVDPVKDPAALAAVIDKYVGEGYAANKATPAALADDPEFLRRVYLDLTGRIPRRFDVENFLKDKSPNKRATKVAELLESPQYVTHMAQVWRTTLLPNNNNQQVQALAPAMEAWLRKHFARNTPYDEMVRELITTNVTNNPAVVGAFPGGPYDPTGFVFYQANELKPENLAAATSRLFLGVKLECAQCHDAKFDKWKRKQFWEYTAFFSGIGPQQQPQNPDDDPDLTLAADASHRHAVKMPGTSDVMQARFLDGKQPDWKDENVTTREALAAWMTADDNPYFAREAVNRIWGQLFGIGIVDPVDDLRDGNPPSHPELLDAMAKAFIQSHYDIKFMIKAITASKTYQLSSAVDAKSDDLRLFTRMPVKALTPEQLYDSVALATGFADQPDVDPNGIVNPFGGTVRSEFLAKFNNSADSRTETQTSILQALALMNGKITADATHLKRSVKMAAIFDSPWMDDRQKLDALYMCALSRPMHPGEVERMLKYVQKGGPSADHDKALADVFWVLLNSSEFIFNH